MKAYPAKIFLAWAEAIDGNEKFIQWLLQNGYPELICVIDFLWGSTKAGNWFMTNKMPQWRAFAEYVGDKNENARQWLLINGYDHLALVGDAIYNKSGALQALDKKGLPELLILAQILNKLLYKIEFDTNLVYRSPLS